MWQQLFPCSELWYLPTKIHGVTTMKTKICTIPPARHAGSPLSCCKYNRLATCCMARRATDSYCRDFLHKQMVWVSVSYLQVLTALYRLPSWQLWPHSLNKRLNVFNMSDLAWHTCNFGAIILHKAFVFVQEKTKCTKPKLDAWQLRISLTLTSAVYVFSRFLSPRP